MVLGRRAPARTACPSEIDLPRPSSPPQSRRYVVELGATSVGGTAYGLVVPFAMTLTRPSSVLRAVVVVRVVNRLGGFGMSFLGLRLVRDLGMSLGGMTAIALADLATRAYLSGTLDLVTPQVQVVAVAHVDGIHG